MLNVPAGKPAEADEPEVAVKAVPVGVVAGLAFLNVGFGDALEDGLAPSLGLDVAVDGVKGFAIGADAEGVGAYGEA